MTEKRDPTPEEHRSEPTIRRRVVIQGVSWTVPTALVSIAAPAMALSSYDGLSFSSPCLSSAAGVVDPVTIALEPPAAVAVTITLPAGYRFSSGDTTTTVTTGPGGTVDVTDIEATATAAGGDVVATLDSDPSISASTLLAAPEAAASSWGYNGSANAVQGVYGSPRPFAAMAGLPAGDPIAVLGGGLASFYAITASGALYSGGWNVYGQLGTGSTSDSAVFLPAVNGVTGAPLDGVVSVPGSATEDAIGVVELSDGTWWASGENKTNQLQRSAGDPGGATGSSNVFYPIGSNVSSLSGSSIRQYVHGAESDGIFIMDDGSAWLAGSGTNRYPGSGTSTPSSSNGFCVAALTGPGAPFTDARRAEIGNSSSAAILTDSGTVWIAGGGFVPAGVAYDAQYFKAIPNPSGVAFTDLRSNKLYPHYYARAGNGTWYSIGTNATGASGTGQTTAVTSWTPVAAPIGSTIADVVPGGNQTTFLMTDGSVWYSGNDDSGNNGSGGIQPTSYGLTRYTFVTGATGLAATYYDSIAVISPQGRDADCPEE